MEQQVHTFDSLPLMLNANDIAGILGISRAFAYNLLHSEGFPVTVIGKRRLVMRESFLIWLRMKEQGAC